MDYTGVVIKESLQKKAVLKKIKIVSTKVEAVTEKHKTPWLKQWTLNTIEVPEEKAQEIAKKYGISIGIPEYQVDFAPNDTVWEKEK